MRKLTKKITRKVSDLNLSRIVGLVYSVAPMLTIATVCFVILESLLWLGTIYATKNAIDTIGKLTKSGASEQILIQNLLFAVVLSIGYVISKFISSYVTEFQASKVSEYLDDKIHEHSVHLDLAFFESPDYFDILKRAKDAGPDKPTAIIIDIIDLVKNSAMLFTIALILFKINWALLPILFLFAIPTVWVRIRLAKRLHTWRMAQTATERKASYYSYLITSDTTAKEIRAFGIGNYLRGIYLDMRLSLLKGRMAIKRKNTFAELGSSILAIMGVFCCIAAIAFSIIHGDSSTGDITIFLVVFLQSFTVMGAITGGITKIYQNNIIIKSIFELFDIENEVPKKELTTATQINEQILLKTEQLSFSYPNSKKIALQDINIELRKGQLIAIVGFNGSGKSTLIKLLCRLYQPSEGNVFVEQQNINSFEADDYRKIISPVFQDFVRYNVTVNDNIRFGDINTSVDETRIHAAADAAGASPFINELPNKHDTLMGKIFEEGHEISIGQWQKLAIARALYSKSKIIILDEATSALDARSEEVLFRDFKSNIGDRAAIVISHRLSTIQQADYIYVISEGKITQSGKHCELMETDGDYKALFNPDKTK